MFYKKITAFTLAEILVTLMIIGVISAVTIPSLKESSDKSANLALLQKAYSTASNAFAQLQTENGSPLYWKLPNGNRVFTDGTSENISKFLQQKMNVASKTDFISSDYKIKSLKGNDSDSFQIDDTTVAIKDNASAFQTADGMMWFPSNTYSGCQHEKEMTRFSAFYQPSFFEKFFLISPVYAAPFIKITQTIYLCGLLIVDTNGPKKPNRMGIDVFVFDITTEGVKPHSGADDCSNLNGNGYTCSAKALSGNPKALDFIYD